MIQYEQNLLQNGDASMGTISGQDRYQLSLPSSLDDSIGSENFTGTIDAFVDSLDLEDLGFANVIPSHMGRKRYASEDMLKLFV